jgi:hypothetical protein
MLELQKKKRFKRFKFKIKKKNKKKNYKNIMRNLISKHTKGKNLLYFLKYYLIFRRRSYKLYSLARLKAKLHKKKVLLRRNKIIQLGSYFFKKYAKRPFNKKQSIILSNINLFFSSDDRYDRQPKLYDIKKKYIRYLSSNRLIYKLFGFRCKHNFKFIKRQVRAISGLNIKDRIHMHEYSLKNILIRLKYAFTYRNAKNLIKSGFIFLNGKQELNYNSYMFKGDYIEFLYCKLVLKMRKKIKKKLFVSMRKYKRYN